MNHSKYELEYLIKKFSEDSVRFISESKERNIELDFNIAEALLTICEEINKLKQK